MYWSILFCVIFISDAPASGQRRALVHYPLTSPDEPEPVSENPLSSSINSIQTGREELVGYHRGDSVSGGTHRRGYQKTTTPDYFKESIIKGDSPNTGKEQHGTESSESDAKANGESSSNGDKVERRQTDGAPADKRSDGGTIVVKDKRSSGFESPTSSTVRPPELDQSGGGRGSHTKDRAKETMDINKGTSVRDQERRSNTHETRRQTTTPTSSPNARFNSSVRESADRNREELSEKSLHERLNRERRPTGSVDTSRGQRTATRPTSDKGHTPTSRIPDAPRYDRTVHAVSSTDSNERKVPDRSLEVRDSFGNVSEEKKDLEGEPNLPDKVYPPENEGSNFTLVNKPTHLLIGEERVVQASRSPDVYSDEIRGGSKDDLHGKAGSDTEKSSVVGDGKVYAERPYIRDDDGEERSPGHRGRDVDRSYARRHRDDRYDGRTYDEHTQKESQAARDRVRDGTYDSQGKTAGRSSRPKDAAYDDDYKDDAYSYRDVKDSDSGRKDRPRAGRRPYSTSGEDVDDTEKYASDGTRIYRDHSDDRRYRDERVPSDRDDGRRYRDEDTRKYRADGTRIYDDYEDTDRYRDSYNRRYEKDGERRRYGDGSTQSYVGSGSRRYEDDETRRTPSEYDKSVRRYRNESDYPYNDTQRYRDDYDGYRDDYSRSSGESGSSRRYDERDGTRDTRYDDEDYKGSRGYSTRDNDRRYIRRENEGTSHRRDGTRKYATGDSPRYRGDDDDSRRYRDEPRVYGESSPKDRYDQDSRRTYEEGGGSAYVETPPVYPEHSETSTRREYSDMNRQRENNGSGRSRGEGSYRNPTYADDEYYDNRTSTGNVHRYDEDYRPRRRTGDDSVGYVGSDGDSRKYNSRSSDERRRDRDRVYADTSSTRRRSDTDDTRRDGTRVYDDDRYSDRSRGDRYDDRAYVGRTDDEYGRSARDRVRDYDTRVYKDSDEEIDTHRARDDVTDRYGSTDAVRDRTADGELRKARPSSGRTRDKDYVDRRYEDRSRDETSGGTYRYHEDDERYRYPPSEDGKVEYKDTERTNRGTQRFSDDYDRTYDRDLNTRRNTDERRRGGDRPNRGDDRYVGGRGEFDEKAPERPPPKIDTTLRDDAKSGSPSSRNDETLLKGSRGDHYDEDRRSGDKRSQTRDVQPDVRIPRTQYTSQSDDTPQKPNVPETRPDSLDKGDFARGRRTSFYNEDDKTDSDRDEGAKASRDERRVSRTGENKESSYTRSEKGRPSTYDSRTGDRSSSRPSSEGRTYSNRREISETTRHKTKDEIPVIRVPSDLLPSSDDPEFSETAGDATKLAISQSGDETHGRRYSSVSSYDRGSRRRLPNLRESEMDGHARRDEAEDSSLPENRGRYRYTKSRGDREDFARDADDGSFVTSGGYISRGKSSKDDRRDMPKGEYDSPISGTPTRSKEDRIPVDPAGHLDKDEYYPPSRDKVPPRSGRDFDRRDKVARDRDTIGRDERVIYEKGQRPRSPSQDDETFREGNITSDRYETSSVDVHANNDPTLLVASQNAPGVRSQGPTISRTATPIPNYPDKDFVARNTSSKSGSDKMSTVAINREKRFQYDERLNTNSTSRSVPGVNDELSKRPLTTKEVIEAAYRHTDEPEKQREIFYPVYVPGSGNMTSPDIIRPSERRGITTPTKKKKKK